MRRRIWVPLVVLPVLLGGWLMGRAPSTGALRREAARFHADRLERLRALDLSIAQQETRAVHGRPAPGLDGLRAEKRAFLSEVRREEIGGWEVVFVPAGAPRPDAADFFVAGQVEPARANDPPELHGPMEVWYAPRSRLARTVRALRAEGAPALD